MPQFNNLKALCSYIMDKIEKAMDTNVAQTVKEVQRKHVYKDVYEQYPEPKKYKRKKDDGGLSSIDNMDHDIDRSGNEITLKVINTRTDEKTGKYIPYVVEYGIGYDYTGYGYVYEEPRPFISETKNDLELNKQHVKALKEALKQSMEVK